MGCCAYLIYKVNPSKTKAAHQHAIEGYWIYPYWLNSNLLFSV